MTIQTIDCILALFKGDSNLLQSASSQHLHFRHSTCDTISGKSSQYKLNFISSYTFLSSCGEAGVTSALITLKRSPILPLIGQNHSFRTMPIVVFSQRSVLTTKATGWRLHAFYTSRCLSALCFVLRLTRQRWIPKRLPRGRKMPEPLRNRYRFVSVYIQAAVYKFLKASSSISIGGIWLSAKRLNFISLVRMLGDILVYTGKRNLFYWPGEVCSAIEIRVPLR